MTSTMTGQCSQLPWTLDSASVRYGIGTGLYRGLVFSRVYLPHAAGLPFILCKETCALATAHEILLRCNPCGTFGRTSLISSCLLLLVSSNAAVSGVPFCSHCNLFLLNIIMIAIAWSSSFSVKCHGVPHWPLSFSPSFMLLYKEWIFKFDRGWIFRSMERKISYYPTQNAVLRYKHSFSNSTESGSDVHCSWFAFVLIPNFLPRKMPAVWIHLGTLCLLVLAFLTGVGVAVEIRSIEDVRTK